MKNWKSNKELTSGFFVLGGMFFPPLALFILYKMIPEIPKMKLAIVSSVVLTTVWISYQYLN